MRLTDYVIWILILGGLLYGIGYVANDFDTTYPTYGYSINQNFSEKYNYAGEINNSFSGLKDKWETLADNDVSWFKRLAAGVVAIPMAVVGFPIVIIGSVMKATVILTGLAKDIALPAPLIGIAIIILIIIIVRGLNEMFQRSRT